MWYINPKVIPLGLLSLQIIWSNANPVVRTTECVDASCSDHSAIDWAEIAAVNLPLDLSRRAGGGGRPNGRPAGRPDDPNNPSDPSSQTGESGGFGNTKETTGGFTGLCDKRSWFSLWPRAGCGEETFPPSVRNNNNKPAVVEDDTYQPPLNHRIDVNARKQEFENIIRDKNLQNRPWFFYSGIGYEEQLKYKDAVHYKLGFTDGDKDTNKENDPVVYMGNIIDLKPGSSSTFGYAKYEGNTRAEKYFWAANSKAYSQAVRGNIYVTIPGGRAVNQPYSNKGSNWWSYELPELTRNPHVTSITVMPTKEITALSLRESDDVVFGPTEVIWRQGDDPIGYPADEQKEVKLPEEPWKPLAEIADT